MTTVSQIRQQRRRSMLLILCRQWFLPSVVIILCSLDTQQLSSAWSYSGGCCSRNRHVVIPPQQRRKAAAAGVLTSNEVLHLVVPGSCSSLSSGSSPLFMSQRVNDDDNEGYQTAMESDTDMDDEDDTSQLSDEELEASMGLWDDRIARYNTIHLTGRIGNTPETKYFDDGKVVTNVNIATKRKYHTMDRKANNIKTGDEETDWYALEIWGQTAEFVAKFVDKGARVGVVGQLQVDSWTDKVTGELRNRPKVIVRDLDVLETKAEADLRRRKDNNDRPSVRYEDDDDDDEFDGPSRSASMSFFNM